jgi:hypothetical protein
MARRRFSMRATTHQGSTASRTIPARAPGLDVMGGPDRGARFDVMGHPNPAPGVDVMGGPDRGVRLDVMGRSNLAPGVDVMGGPDHGVRLDVMGHSDPRLLDSHLGADGLGAHQEVKALTALRDPTPQQPRRAA